MKAMAGSWSLRLVMVGALALGAAACDDEVPTAPNNPGNPVTETFSGSVTQNGAQTHSFSTATSGTVTATLKEVAPSADLVIGFSLGNWNGTSCQIVVAKDAATVGAVVTGTMSGTGTLCVRVYDVGNISTTPATYTVEVVHP
jgi:hypothetical protein